MNRYLTFVVLAILLGMILIAISGCAQPGTTTIDDLTPSSVQPDGVLDLETGEFIPGPDWEGPVPQAPKIITIDGQAIEVRNGVGYFAGTNVKAMWIEVGDDPKDWILGTTGEDRDGVYWEFDPKSGRWNSTGKNAHALD